MIACHDLSQFCNLETQCLQDLYSWRVGPTGQVWGHPHTPAYGELDLTQGKGKFLSQVRSKCFTMKEGIISTFSLN